MWSNVVVSLMPCCRQMQGSTWTDGQLSHSCHGFVAMSCQTVQEVQQIPCREASRLSDSEISVQRPNWWFWCLTMFDILFMSHWCFLYSWTQPKSPFLLIAYAYRFFVASRVKMSANCCLMTCCENPTFIWQDLNSLLIRESEALREVPSDPTTETTAKFELCPRARGSKYMVQILKMVL